MPVVFYFIAKLIFVIVHHISQIRVVERELQEYHENEGSKEEAQKCMNVEEQPPTSSLMNDEQCVAPVATNY